MRSTQLRRLAGGAAALALIGATLISSAGTALAATTRFIYVGPDPNFTANNGVLSFTPVSAGQATASTVYIKNIDNQTLTHVVLTFAQSQGTVSISDTVYGPDASRCSSSAGTITCDFGNLKANATRSFTLVLTASASGGPYPVHGTVVFNESTNPNGGNPQIDSIDGTLNVDLASCNSLATFLPPGVAKTLLPSDGTTCSSDQQRSGLLVPAAINGNVVSLQDGIDPGTCPSGFTCLGTAVSATVNDGSVISPYLRWTIFYSASLLGNINPNKVAFVHDTTIIPAGNKGACKTSSSIDCIESTTTITAGTTFVIRTQTNGLIKGMN